MSCVVMHVGMHRHGAGIRLGLSAGVGSVAPLVHQLVGWRLPVGRRLHIIVLPHGAVSIRGGPLSAAPLRAAADVSCATEGRGMRSCSGASGTLLEGRCGLGSACDHFEAQGSKVSADSFWGQTFGA